MLNTQNTRLNVLKEQTADSDLSESTLLIKKNPKTFKVKHNMFQISVLLLETQKCISAWAVSEFHLVQFP